MTFEQYASGAFALAGAIIGGLISFGAQAYISKTSYDRERKAVAAAIAAEIEAYIRVVAMRDTLRRAEGMIATLRAGFDVPLRGLGVDADEDPEAAFPIFRAAINKLGLLGPLAGEVATFYATASAVRATAQAGERGAFEIMSPADKATFVREELDVFQECIVLGKRLAGRLNAL